MDLARSIAMTELSRHIPCFVGTYPDKPLRPNFAVKRWRVDLRTFPPRLEGFGPLPTQADSSQVEETKLDVAVTVELSSGIPHRIKISAPLPDYTAFHEPKLGGYTRESCAVRFPREGQLQASMPTVRDEIDEVVEQLLQASLEQSCSPLDRRLFTRFWYSRMVKLGRSVRRCWVTDRSRALDVEYLRKIQDELSSMLL